MESPEDPTPDVPSIDAGRRAHLLLLACGKEVLKLAAFVGVVYVLNSTASGVRVTDTPIDGESLGRLVQVPGFPKMQAWGTNYSQHRLREIAPYSYFRRPARAV